MNKPCDERECIYERLDAFIEFAEATKKFHDADFYKHLKKELQQRDDLIKELNEELDIYYNPTDY